MKIKIKFKCDNGANIHSERSETIEYDAEEWEAMSETDRDEVVRDWAMEKFCFWYEECD